MEKIDKIHTKSTQLINEKKLKPNERIIYRFLVEGIGNSRIPVQLHYKFISNLFKLNGNQISRIINKLVNYGLIEKWNAYDKSITGLLKRKIYVRLNIIKNYKSESEK